MAARALGLGLSALAAVLLGVAPAAAQPGTVPGMGSMMPQSSRLNFGQGDSTQTTVPDSETGVSFIDSALVSSQVRMMIDGNYRNRNPARAEYIFPQSGTPGNRGWGQPESSVDWHDVISYIEVAFADSMSGFVQIPTRWVDPEVNSNDWGLTDIQFGVKWAFLSMPGLTTTLQLKGTIPSRSGPGLSMGHYAVEPALLLNLRLVEWLALEGEARYNVPFSGTDFSGDVFRYGLGIALGQRSYDDFWFTPVVELIGWTVIDGKDFVYLSPGVGVVRPANGDTIANAMAGMRFGFGDHGDIYIGYGTSLTSNAWQNELWRLEFRVRF